VIPDAALRGGGQQSRAAPGRCDPFTACFLLLLNQPLLLLFPYLFACTLTGQRGLHAFFLAGFEVERVALHLFNNVFLLHFALKAAQGIFKRFALLQSYFRQTDTPPDPPGRTE
jgi:hypothetical protein